MLKSLTAAGMPTIQDGEWLLSFARISWTDKMTIEYDGEKTNIRLYVPLYRIKYRTDPLY